MCFFLVTSLFISVNNKQLINNDELINNTYMYMILYDRSNDHWDIFFLPYEFVE